MSIEEKLEKAKKLGVEPAELSEPEKENLSSIVSLLKEILDAVLKRALEMPKDNAFNLVKNYTAAMEHAENPTVPFYQTPLEGVEEAVKPEPVEHPKLEVILEGLSEDMQRKARELLDCVKTYLKVEEEEGDGSLALCPDCTPEKVVECIRTADPSVRDEMDQKGAEFRKVAR